MGRASKSSTGKGKNKGPKGKKARAKAKLDRQWGEVEQTSEETRRSGQNRRLHSSQTATSSLLSKAEAKQVNQDHRDAKRLLPHDDQDANDDQSVEAESEDALASLLKSIRKTSKTWRTGSTDNSDDESMSSDSEGDRNGADSMNKGRSSDESDEEELERKALDYDPFTKRFTRNALSENDNERQTFLEKVHQTEALNCSLDASLVYQVSKVLLDQLQLERTNESASIDSQLRSVARSFWHASKDALQSGWARHRPSSRQLDSSQSRLYPLLASYADLCIMTESSLSARQSTNNLLAYHILNHVWTRQSRIARHHQKLQRRLRNHGDKHESETVDIVAKDDEEEPPRAQGFTRPSVLILLPTRGCCYEFVNRMLELLPSAPDNAERFESEYGPASVMPTEESSERSANEQAKRRRQILRQKGQEWLDLFGDAVNDDDDFKLGLSLNQSKGSIRMYTDFYKSDIIIASPIGLKILDENKERGFDFLSSIEICYLGRADVLLMQNWDHVQDAIKLINHLPKSSTEIDFSVVRPYLLAGQSEHWRQLVITSSFSDPMILSLFKRYAKSHSGIARLRRKTLDSDASITRILLPTRQVFQRVTTTSLKGYAADRVKYFCDSVLPEIPRNKQKHTMVFIASYFDFVSVRNVMLKREIEFVSVTEYSRTSEISRGRARFLQGRKPIMLYTGRAHYFHRHAIKGIRHLIFLGLPECADFYPGLVNLLNEGLEGDESSKSSTASCMTLFTKYDGHALERIVGSSNCLRMLNGEKTTFLF